MTPEHSGVCDSCGCYNTRCTVCGTAVLCQGCEYQHHDDCATCARYHAEDQAALRTWQAWRKGPDYDQSARWHPNWQPQPTEAS